MVRLVAVGDMKRLAPTPSTGYAALRRFAQAAIHGAPAVATSAVREAENRR